MRVPVRRGELHRSLEPVDRYLTAAAVEELKADLRRLERRRPAAVEELTAAREMGDLSENAAYTEAKARLRRMDGAIERIKDRLRHAVIIEEGSPDGRACIGASVKVRVADTGKERTYLITGSQESDPLAGRISHASPLGQALLGRSAGDRVTVQAASGKAVGYEIVAVE
jgi:transcription elongation factor GreA